MSFLEAGRAQDYLRIASFFEEKQANLEALALLAKQCCLESRLNSVLNLGQKADVTYFRPLLASAVADKEKSRRQARMKSWPEKIAVIERLQKNSRLAKAAMQERRRKIATSKSP